MKFGFKLYFDPENDGAGVGSASAESVEDSGPTLAQALAADRGIVTTSVASPPAATSPVTTPTPQVQPISEPASPQAPVTSGQAPDSSDEPPLPPGVSPTGVTPNPAILAQQQAQQAELAQRQQLYVQNTQLQNTYNEAIRLGATPEQAKAAIQLLNTQRTIAQQQEALENHPVTREIAAKQIAAQYAKWGVKSEDIISAPNPQAMQYAAYTLAQANKANGNTQKAANLQARTANGNDSFESGSTNGAGATIDYRKSSGLSLMRRALAMAK